jgi:CIC family chloride channel protein
VVKGSDPFQKIVDLTNETGTANFVVIDEKGLYKGMVVSDDIQTALLQREAVPLLLVDEVMRSNVPTVRSSDDLSAVLDTFSLHDVSHLPVCIADSPGRIIGLISRSALMRRYQKGLLESD